ncbi:MAG: glycosyltransferase family 39 protein [Bryobacteraceae bacterium]
MPNKRHTVLVAAGVACLLAILVTQMALSIRQESLTWDEDDHILAGYMSWKTGDFGLNPEHPPLVKLLATIPILNMPLHVPKLQGRNFKIEAFLDGKEFLSKNDADTILFRVRMAASLLTVLMVLLVFLAATEMFSLTAGFIALALVAFDPNLLAHGAFVTTDMGLSCFLFASVYALYRYVKAPSAWRLALVGVAAGCALAAKHTGVLVFPMLLALAVFEAFRRRGWRPRARLALALVLIAIIAVAVLWAFYGFRYQARPQGLAMNPPLAEFARGLKPFDGWLISTCARWHLLPESYLYGFVDVRYMVGYYPSYIFGKVYPHGVWFYFPSAFAIKSTIPFLALLMLAAVAIATGKLRDWRAIVFLSVPAAIHFAVATSSTINIGLRHILPVYVFLIVLVAGAAWAFLRKDRRWAWAVGLLLVFQAVSSARSFPAYIAYANELWGGPSNTYKYLSDSNTDWAQQLKAAKKYLDGRGVKNCWFAYFAEGVVDSTGYYGIPCKPLITADTMWVNEETNVPPVIDGPVLISAGTLSGFEFGSSDLNPYRQFLWLKPAAMIQNGILVFDGRFPVALASALSRVQKARNLMRDRQLNQALAEAHMAVAVDPGCFGAQQTLGDALMALHCGDEARAAWQQALSLAKKLEPGVREDRIRDIERRLASK